MGIYDRLLEVDTDRSLIKVGADIQASKSIDISKLREVGDGVQPVWLEFRITEAVVGAGDIFFGVVLSDAEVELGGPPSKFMALSELYAPADLVLHKKIRVAVPKRPQPGHLAQKLFMGATYFWQPNVNYTAGKVTAIFCTDPSDGVRIYPDGLP